MGEDASLDEFLGGDVDGGSASGPDADGEPSVEPESDLDPSAESVEPATTTYEFVPGGVACESCGTTVDRRWHQDGSLVCGACKDW